MTEALDARPAPETLARALGAVFFVVAIGWWMLTDRLDLLKLGLAVVGSLVLWVGAIAAGGRSGRVFAGWPLAGIALAALGATALASEQMFARIEGWAPWLAFGAVLVFARHVDRQVIARWVALTAGAVGLVALVQALGLPLFGADSLSVGGRAVVGTMGGPGHLGWFCAASLPWVARAAIDLVEGRHEDVDSDAGPAAEPDAANGRVARWAAIAGYVVVVSAVVASGSRTAWVMAIASAPFWLRPRGAWWRPALVGLALGVGLAVTIDLVAQTTQLGARVTEIAAPTGTSTGRLYIWVILISHVTTWFGFGFGPETFQRLWPSMQRNHLDANPQNLEFFTDLRHAHADLVELTVDFGVIGTAAFLYLCYLAIRRASQATRPAVGTVLAVLIGGLAAPLLFFVPTALLMAIALGVALPISSYESLASAGRRLWLANGALVLALALALWPLGIRLASEIARTEATAARAGGDRQAAETLARKSVALDPRNPRGWIEVAEACERNLDARCALRAWTTAAIDLPTDAVLVRQFGARIAVRRLDALQTATEDDDSDLPPDERRVF